MRLQELNGKRAYFELISDHIPYGYKKGEVVNLYVEKFALGSGFQLHNPGELNERNGHYYRPMKETPEGRKTSRIFHIGGSENRISQVLKFSHRDTFYEYFTRLMNTFNVGPNFINETLNNHKFIEGKGHNYDFDKVKELCALEQKRQDDEKRKHVTQK